MNEEEKISDHIEKLRGLIDFHILTAAEYLKQIHLLEDRLKNGI